MSIRRCYLSQGKIETGDQGSHLLSCVGKQIVLSRLVAHVPNSEKQMWKYTLQIKHNLWYTK